LLAELRANYSRHVANLDDKSPAWTTGEIATLTGQITRCSENPRALADAVAEMDRAALTVWRSDPVRYAEHYGLLADYYCGEYGRLCESEKLEAALLWYRHIEHVEPNSALIAGRIRLLKTSLELATAHRAGGSDAMATKLKSVCATLREEIQGFPAPALLADLAINANKWGKAAVSNKKWSAAADAYDLGARAADQLYRTVPLHERPMVVAVYRRLHADTASVLLRVGRIAEAAVTVEASRQLQVRFWQSGADMRDRLREQNQELYFRFLTDQTAWEHAASASMRARGTAAVTHAVESLKATQLQLVRTLEEVRKVSGFERIYTRPSLAEITEATSERPILYLWTSSFDTALILVMPDGSLNGAYIDGMTIDYLDRVMARWATGPSPHEFLPHLAALLEQNLAKAIYDVITRPLREQVDSDGWRWESVTIVASGPLSFFPLHAWEPCLVDENTGEITTILPLSYAPSARQLNRIRPHSPDSGRNRRLLSLADPEPRRVGLNPLPCARLESALIAETAGESLLLSGVQASREAFFANVATHDVIHFAGHAHVSGEAGAQLEFGDAAVTIDDMIRCRSLEHVRLVVLNACSTGQQDRLTPEESIDLGSMFLAAGARAAVINLWPVDDLAAALVVSRLFQLWQWGDGLDLTAALSAARLWLRELSVGDLLDMADRDPRWRPAIQRYAPATARTVRRFANPYYWSAFALTGT